MNDESEESAESDADEEGWVPLEDRIDETGGEQTGPFGGVVDGDSQVDEPEGDDDALYPWASGRGSTNGDAPWLGAEPDEFDGPDVPGYVEWLGQVGVYSAVLGLALAVGGVSLAAGDIQPYANMFLTISLAVVFGAMLLGIVFQAFASDVGFSE
ncbi:hypothetical protein BRC62_02090 [Halobacteriales archaeon QH_10_67_13]|nr:MAG: hypothetical protein BRC62_02090 [Halobacteriales archaeon QH_10_67_13]